MPYRLREDLYFSAVEEHFIFFDLKADRYFCLPPTMTEAFRAVVDGATPSPFQHQMLESLAHRGLLIPSQNARAPVPMIAPRPISSLTATPHASVPVGDVFGALAAQYAVWRKLRTQGFQGAIARLRQRKVAARPGASSRPAAQRVIDAFAASDIVYSPHDRCLMRTLALFERLMSQGVAANLCVGVKLPFLAHAWTQSENVVLGDAWEQVSTYTPILVV
jgi:hypothetical protein